MRGYGMNQKTIYLSFFVVCFVFLFGAGVFGTYISIKNVYEINLIDKNEKKEKALITKKVETIKTPNNTFYFKLENGDEDHGIHLVKILSSKLKQGDTVEVKYNRDKKLWLIVGYEKALYVRYFMQIVLFVVCFLLSTLFFYGLIYIIRKL
jgi:hypothetical protein